MCLIVLKRLNMYYYASRQFFFNKKQSFFTLNIENKKTIKQQQKYFHFLIKKYSVKTIHIFISYFVFETEFITVGESIQLTFQNSG